MKDDDLEPTIPDDSTLGSSPVSRGGSLRFVENYRLLQKVGEGGMGEVYEAEQLKPVRRRVAVKIIKRGMDTDAVVARFESERLELFIKVCEGVQHAHQKAIIHRDIKPSNVLVTIQDDEAVPKIIDFGVAKATAQRLTERTMFTEMGQLVGTPEYMSPEQAEMTGQNIDTRTDVYIAQAAGFDTETLFPYLDASVAGSGYLDVLNLSAGGDVTRQMSFKYIAARLNQAVFQVPAATATLLDDFDLYFAAHPVGSDPRGQAKNQGQALLGDLNNHFTVVGEQNCPAPDDF